MTDAEKNEPERLGVVELSYSLLSKLIGLPEGHSIVGANVVDSFHRFPYIEIMVKGPLMPEAAPAERAQRVVGVLTTTEHGTSLSSFSKSRP